MNTMNQVPSDPPSPSLDRLVTQGAQIFKLLSDETRLRILWYLAQSESGSLHVNALVDLLGGSQPAVSHHLALLRAAGLVKTSRRKKYIYYSLRVHQIRDLIEQFFEHTPGSGRRIHMEDIVLILESTSVLDE